MNYNAEKEEFELKSGRKICSVFKGSIAPHSNTGRLLIMKACSFENFNLPEERKEIAEYMINLWREWGSAT